LANTCSIGLRSGEYLRSAKVRAGLWRPGARRAGPRRNGGSCWFWPWFHRGRRGGSDRPGVGICARASGVWRCPLGRARAQPGSFFERDPFAAEAPAQHRSVRLDAAFGEKPGAQRFPPDVGRRPPHAEKKRLVRLERRRAMAAGADRVRAPDARKRCSHFTAVDSPTPNRRAAARQLMPALSTSVNQPIPQILRIGLAPCLPTSAQPAG